MTFRTSLVDLINSSHSEAWSIFDKLKKNPKLYKLDPAKVKAWQSPGEPAFVANLLEYTFAKNRLRRIVFDYLHPQGLSKGAPMVSGIFIHQKPKVLFGGAPRVELGDVMFVRQHFQSHHATPYSRAFLLQAKSSINSGTGALQGNEAKQHALYTDWKASRFIFPNKEFGLPPDGAKKWDFSVPKGGGAAHTGVYGIVANMRSQTSPGLFPDDCAWAVGLPAASPKGTPPSVNATSSLAAALEGFFLGTFGREWSQTAPATDHWSAFVKEILVASPAWEYQAQRANMAGRPRQLRMLAFADAFRNYRREQHPERPFDGSLTLWPNSPMPYFAQRAMWMKSCADDGPDGPSYIEGEWQSNGRRRGMSVVYIATFGDQPLHEHEGPLSHNVP
jgi:hypothetical protein